MQKYIYRQFALWRTHMRKKRKKPLGAESGNFQNRLAGLLHCNMLPIVILRTVLWKKSFFHCSIWGLYRALLSVHIAWMLNLCSFHTCRLKPNTFQTFSHSLLRLEERLCNIYTLRVFVWKICWSILFCAACLCFAQTLVFCEQLDIFCKIQDLYYKLQRVFPPTKTSPPLNAANHEKKCFCSHEGVKHFTASDNLSVAHLDV